MRRLIQHLRQYPVDTAIGVVGVAAFVVGFAAGPLAVAGPAIGTAAAAGIVLVLRHSGDEGGGGR